MAVDTAVKRRRIIDYGSLSPIHDPTDSDLTANRYQDSGLYYNDEVIPPATNLPRWRLLQHGSLSPIYHPQETSNYNKRFQTLGMIYHTPDDFNDSRRTRIRKALVLNIEKITQSNGYNVNIGDVSKDVEADELMLNYPSVTIDIEREDYRSAAGFHALGYLPKRLFVNLAFTVKNLSKLKTEEMKVLADTEKVLMNNRHLPNGSGYGTVNGDMMFIDDDIIGIDGNSPAGRIILKLRIDYLQNQLNPRSKLPATTRPTLSSAPPATVSVSRRESMREALILNLKKIISGDDYFNTVYVPDRAMSFEKIKRFPCIIPVQEPEDVRNYESNTYHDSLLHKTMHYNLYCFMKDMEDIVERREQILSDVEKVLMNNITLPDSNGYRTCISCMLTSNDRFGISDNMPTGGIKIGLRVYYRQFITDPIQQHS